MKILLSMTSIRVSLVLVGQWHSYTHTHTHHTTLHPPAQPPRITQSTLNLKQINFPPIPSTLGNTEINRTIRHAGQTRSSKSTTSRPHFHSQRDTLTRTFEYSWWKKKYPGRAFGVETEYSVCRRRGALMSERRRKG